MEANIASLTKQVSRLAKRLEALESNSDTQPISIVPVEVNVVADLGYAVDYLRGVGCQAPGQMPTASRVLEVDRDSYAKVEATAFRSTIRSALQQGKYLVIAQSSMPVTAQVGKNTLYKIGHHVYLIK